MFAGGDLFMEPVKQAGDHPALGDGAESRQEPGGRRWPGDPAAALAGDYAASGIRAVKLNEARLESRRIISYDVADQRSKSFDMLRTQVLQSMDAKGWQVMAVTSPTAGCGKTLTAINLAISIARQPERSVLLADMDLRKPQGVRRLGLKCDAGLLGVLEGQVTLTEARLSTQADRHATLEMPAE